MVDEVIARVVLLSPALLFLGALALGVGADRIVLGQLRRLASRTQWGYDEVVIRALGGSIVLWFALGGANLAFLRLPLDGTTATVLRDASLVLGILSVTVVCARIAVGWFSLYTKRMRAVFPSTSLFANLLAALVYTIGALVILQSLSIPITPILTAMGVGGLAVALALQETLSNLFAGLHIIISRKVRLGDYVELESGQAGTVVDITWRNTAINELRGNLIIVPNAKLSSAILTNYSRPETHLTVLLPLSVSYDSDLEHVEAVTLAVARDVVREVPGVVSEFEPLVRFKGFADSGIDFNLVLRAREFVDQYAIRDQLIRRLHRRYRDEGIDIPFPARTVYLRPANPAENGAAHRPAVPAAIHGVGSGSQQS